MESENQGLFDTSGDQRVLFLESMMVDSRLALTIIISQDCVSLPSRPHLDDEGHREHLSLSIRRTFTKFGRGQSTEYTKNTIIMNR